MKILNILVFVVVAVGIAIGGRWYTYVTNTETPYDEVGIELNGYMPGPIRAWGCGKLHQTFPGRIPPLYCGQPGSQKDWLQ